MKPMRCRRPLDRVWRQRCALPDLDALFATAMQEMPMPGAITVELLLPGLQRPLRMPAARQHWRIRGEVAPAVAERAERLIDAIGRVASS